MTFQKAPGTLTFISGPMFSGKTEELLRIASSYLIAGFQVRYFKPQSDNRYGSGVIMTHNQRSVVSEEVSGLLHISSILSNMHDPCDAIFIDEVQFLSSDQAETIIPYWLDDLKIKVYCSGLILDSYRKPFPTSQTILPYATDIKMLTSVCNGCGCFDAIYTYRKKECQNTEQVFVGGAEEYLALCESCYSEQ